MAWRKAGTARGAYVRLGGIYGDGPSFLGTASAPFDPGGQAQQNMRLQLTQNRLGDR